MKKIIVFLFSLILSAVFSTSALAYNVEIDGIYYNLNSEGNTAEVTSGDIKYSGSITIPSSIKVNAVDYAVTSIGGSAFSSCSSLNSVTIGNSVTSIGNYAFEQCSGLTSLTIPNSVTSIGRWAFYACRGLTSVTISNSVTSIGDYVFRDCSGLTSVTIPNSVKSIGYYAFYGCSGLTSLTIPNSVTSIGSWAFYGCRGLKSVTIPNSVTSIGDLAFYGCSGLKDVIIVNNMFVYFPETYSGHYSIPENISQIIGGAFANCSGLTSITIPNSVTSIGRNAFDKCSSLTSVTIPNSVTSINDYAFYGCSGLTSVTIGNSVTYIGNFAFESCSGLTSVTIPNSVTSIRYYAFNGCIRLISVTIPNSVTSIGEKAFANCSKLENVYCYAEKVPSTDGTAFQNSSIASSNLYVPTSALSSYGAKAPWSGFKTITEIPSTIQVEVGSTGKATYCSPLNLDFSSVNGVNAYIASDYNSLEGTITMTKVNEVPAGTGFILKGSAATYNIPVKSDVNTSFVNLLVGTVVKTEVPGTSNGYDNYILGNGEKGVAFYKSNGGGPLAANKAYLRLPASGSSSAKAVRMSFDDDATTEILLLEGENTEETATSPVYDLNGMQKSGISKGWNIVNGKKILIKK